jgi:hypothetical protein
MKESINNCSKYSSHVGEFEKLIASISEVLADDQNNELYQIKLKEQYNSLRAYAEKRCAKFLSEYRKTLPSKDVRDKYREHARVISDTAEFIRDFLIKQAKAVAKDLRMFVRESTDELDETKKSIQTEIENVVMQNMLRHGENFLEKQNWQVIRNEVIPSIIKRHEEIYLQKQATRITNWEEKLRLYCRDLDDMRISKFRELSSKVEDWKKICPENTQMEAYLALMNKRIGQIEAATAFSSIGAVAAKGISIMPSLTNVAGAIISLNPLIITACLAGLAAVVVGRISLGIWGDLEYRQEQYFNQVCSNLKSSLNNEFSSFERQLTNSAMEIAKTFSDVTKKYCEPVYMAAIYSSMSAELEAAVIDRIERDAFKFNEFIQTELQGIELYNR